MLDRGLVAAAQHHGRMQRGVVGLAQRVIHVSEKLLLLCLGCVLVQIVVLEKVLILVLGVFEARLDGWILLRSEVGRRLDKRNTMLLAVFTA